MILTQALSQISVTFFRTFRQMKWYSALLVVKAAAGLGLMVCFLLVGWELNGVITAILISDILCIAIALLVALRQIGFRFPRFTELKSYLKDKQHPIVSRWEEELQIQEVEERPATVSQPPSTQIPTTSFTMPSLELPTSAAPIQGLPAGIGIKIILKNAKIKAEKVIIKVVKE